MPLEPYVQGRVIMIRILTAACLAGLLIAPGACTYVSTTRVEDGHPISQDLDCSGWLPPTLDLGLGLGLATGSALFFSPVVDLGETWNLVGGVGGALAATFFLATAVTGYIWTANCRQAEDLHQQWRLETSDEGKQAIEDEWRRAH
jgi:hypothetical protein